MLREDHHDEVLTPFNDPMGLPGTTVIVMRIRAENVTEASNRRCYFVLMGEGSKYWNWNASGRLDRPEGVLTSCDAASGSTNEFELAFVVPDGEVAGVRGVALNTGGVELVLSPILSPAK